MKNKAIEWEDKYNALPRLPRGENGYIETLKIIFSLINSKKALDYKVKIPGSEASHQLSYYIQLLKHYDFFVTSSDGTLAVNTNLTNLDETTLSKEIAEIFSEKIKYFSEMLEFLKTSKSTKGILEDAKENYNMTWKQKGQIHERIAWLSDMNLIDSMSFKQQYVINKFGEQFLIDHPPTPPIDIKKYIYDKTENEKEIELPNWLSEWNFNTSKDKKDTLGYIPGGRSNATELILETLKFSRNTTSYENIQNHISDQSKYKSSSINSFLTFLTNLEILDRIGEKVYRTSDLGKKLIESDNPNVVLLFFINDHYKYFFELLHELNEKPQEPKELAALGVTQYGMSSDNLDRIRERIAHLKNAELIINDKGKKLRLSNRGKIFYQRIIGAINFDIYTSNTKSEEMIEKDVDDYNNLIQQTRLASVDSANPHNFERLLEQMFQEIGFKTSLEAKAGTTDIVLTAPTAPRYTYKVAIEAKTNRYGKINYTMINFDALNEHKDKHKVDYVAVVGKEFHSKRVFDYSKKHNILLIDINALETLVKTIKITLCKLLNMKKFLLRQV
ncbi:restriction endonuclease [Staphylococcus simulans]|uniref:restriction endonuclease n=1 Tax=Staphylococcus simulans TaxID=1286 RepID=UPI0021D44699|nr:restriction endonuclease [Staphylococcus simulans]UXR32868.1 restriction endonuclease [Staphylococcus simulans]